MSSFKNYIDEDDVPLAQRIKCDSDASKISKRRDSIGAYKIPKRRDSIDASKIFKRRDSIGAKRLRDKFCWICHKENDTYEVKCSNCELTFHTNCMPDINREKVDWKCPECRLAKKPEDWTIGENSLSDLLKHAFQTIVENNGVVSMPEDYTSIKLLVKPVTFDDIFGKIGSAEYPSTHAFLMDIKRLRHNCEILYKYGGFRKKNDFSEFRKYVKSLLEKSEDEIKTLKQCGDCYVKDGNGHHALRVCSKPHIVVWAKFDTYPHWPAKLLEIGDGKKPLLMFFFGDNQIGNVIYDNCYLYSKENPNDVTNLPEQWLDKLTRAMNEAAKYIAKVEEKFGPFCYAAAKTKLIRTKLNEQFDKVLPGFRNAELRKIPSIQNQSSEGSSPNGSGNDESHDTRNDNDCGNGDANHSTEGDTAQIIPDKFEAISKRPSIPINGKFIEQIKELLGYIDGMQADHNAQRAQIAKLFEENRQLEHDKLIEKCANAKLKADFDAQATEMMKLRKEIATLKCDKEMEKSTYAKLDEEQKAEIAELRNTNRALEEKLKTQSDHIFDQGNQIKMSRWCYLCWEKLPIENTTLCQPCDQAIDSS